MVSRIIGPAVAIALAGLWTGAVSAQQVPDTTFTPSLGSPAFAAGQGPVVFVDEGHHNFHTLTGGFQAFGRLAARDGFQVRRARGRITPESLSRAQVLVVANALAERNVEDWSLPTPSAFDSSEIATLRAWVEAGHGLLLIADHMPFPGAVAELAAAFGFRMGNGFAFKTGQVGTFALTRAGGGLRSHAIVDGHGGEPRVDSVRVFTGQAFRADAAVETLLVLGPDCELLLPREAWEFSKDTPREAAGGMLQGAVRHVGKGRIAMFAEAAMFTAQLGGPKRTPMGMNAPEAPQNARFARNVLRWVAEVEP